MDNRKIMENVYMDFFGTSNIKVEEQKNSDIVKLYDDIDSLYIDEKSKELLKKILDYMKLYFEKKETNYISFNLKIVSDNMELTDSVNQILKKAAKSYNYTKKYTVYDLSLYKDFKIDDVYKDSGVVVIHDLKAFELLDINKKEKFIHNLEDYLNKEIITIISGKKEELTNFLNYDNLLSEKYFTFEIVGVKPSIQDIYNDILSKTALTDKLNIELLDYITKTYNDSDLDYVSYKNNLLKNISFNKTVPALKEEKTLDEVFRELDELVGLEKVKKTLHELVDLINLKSKNKDLKINNVNLHMVFLGNPGTGKTTVARIIASILYNLKYIKKNKLIEVSSKDLVAEYVGQTAPKTNSVIEKALGGVLFIDEAYSLATTEQNSYNAEAISTLIQGMENHRDDLVVIFAGYTKEMQSFLDSNSGIVSRIGYTLEFDDYTNDELAQIFLNMMSKAGFIVNEDALIKVKEIIDEYKDTKNFGNARFVRNIYEKTIIKHASNTKDKKNKTILKTITKEDVNADNLIK